MASAVSIRVVFGEVETVINYIVTDT